jgi:hypothetical protein
MNALKKTSAALIAFAMSASAFAGTDLDTRVHELEKKMDMMSMTTAAGTFGPKTALARAEPNGKGWFLTLDVLYWQSKVSGTPYAISVPSNTNAMISQGTMRDLSFDWSFAFKAGLGYNFFHDGWDARAEYTYFRNEASDSYSVESPAAIFPMQPPLLAVTAASKVDFANQRLADFATSSYGTLKLNLNDLILDLGRAFFVSKNLALRPSLGLKATWLTLKGNLRFSGGGVAFTGTLSNQSYSFEGLGSQSVYGAVSQKLFGLGPRAGVDTKWYLGNDISIYGNLAGALLFGYFKGNIQNTYSALPDNILSLISRWHRLVPTVDFELGLMYDRYIMCDTQHFSISLGYETQYYWQASYLGIPLSGVGGVGMYGVNLKFRWDF